MRQGCLPRAGTILLDETFIPKTRRDVVHNPDGPKKRGVSANQRLTMTAMDLSGRAYMRYVGDGRPTKKPCLSTSPTDRRPALRVEGDPVLPSELPAGGHPWTAGFHGLQEKIPRPGQALSAFFDLRFRKRGNPEISRCVREEI